MSGKRQLGLSHIPPWCFCECEGTNLGLIGLLGLYLSVQLQKHCLEASRVQTECSNVATGLIRSLHRAVISAESAKHFLTTEIPPIAFKVEGTHLVKEALTCSWFGDEKWCSFAGQALLKQHGNIYGVVEHALIHYCCLGQSYFTNQHKALFQLEDK